LEFGNVGFYGGRKTGVPGEKPSKQGREPTTNSTHMSDNTKKRGIELEVKKEMSHHLPQKLQGLFRFTLKTNEKQATLSNVMHKLKPLCNEVNPYDLDDRWKAQETRYNR